jgi:hypothetical protein
MDFLSLLWKFVQSGPGLMISGTIILFIFNKIFSLKPAWAKYEGWIISAIKLAEKSIPNNASNKHLKKFDKALAFFIKSYMEAKGKEPGKKLLDEVEQGISILHSQMETNGNLKKKKS